MKASLLTTEYRTLLNTACFHELDGAMTYKHISNHMKNIGRFGAAAFFLKESQSELEHYQRLADFINDMQDVADIPSLPGNYGPVTSLEQAFEMYFNKEYNLGEWYDNAFEECSEPKISKELFHFVGVQRKSIGEAGDLLATLRQCGDDKGALLIFDQSLSK